MTFVGGTGSDWGGKPMLCNMRAMERMSVIRFLNRLNLLLGCLKKVQPFFTIGIN